MPKPPPAPSRPPLKAGSDPQTIVDNSLLLIKAGLEKGQALALSLNHAGYRPPAPPSSTKPS
jgi:hypothetical protein